MSESPAQTLVEDATLAYTLGEQEEALALIDQAVSMDPECFEAWHARAEICLDARRLDDALAAAEKAESLRPGDLHNCVTLSRIWVERGNKERAEHFNAQARMAGWKQTLTEGEG